MHTNARWLPVALGVVALLIAGCAGRRGAEVAAPAPEVSTMRIELLGFPGCPNTPAMRDNLRAALKEIGGGLTFIDTNQEALAEGDLRRGWPTPTVLVNGKDLFGMPAPTAPGMGCRMYEGGVPDARTIAARLRAGGQAE